MSKKVIFFNGFWGGFFEKTIPTNITFFEKLFEKVYNCEIELGNVNNATILVENTQVSNSFKTLKSWEHTYLYSGESYIRSDKDEYSCVLYGNRTHKNIVNVPLFIPYIYSSFDELLITDNKGAVIDSMPEKDVLVVITNTNGAFRNNFLQQLEQHFKVDYAGNYKTNRAIISATYNTPEYFEEVSKYKYVVTMENSVEDTYITEKVINGILGQSLPVYYGSPRVNDYINKKRIITVNENNISEIINKMKNMTNEEWLDKVNAKPFTDFALSYLVNDIASEVRNIIYGNVHGQVTKIVCICNEEFEPTRFKFLNELFKTIGLSNDNIKFICPTYKQTITNKIYNKYIKHNLVLKIRPSKPLKNAELSLTLNFRAALEYITKMYKDGIFLTLESDIMTKNNIYELRRCVSYLKEKQSSWDCMHISDTADADLSPDYCATRLPYREVPPIADILLQPREDISGDNLRFIRKFHTRCTDSLLWTYNGCVKFYNYMLSEEDYGTPFDYYLAQLTEINMNFKFYWSQETYFYQKTVTGQEASTIQND